MKRENIEFDFDNELYGVENRWEKELVELATDFLDEKGYTLERIQKTKDKGETIDIFNEVHWEDDKYGDISAKERSKKITTWTSKEFFSKARDYNHWIDVVMRDNHYYGLVDVLIYGQQLYYEQLAGNALQAVENYINE